MVIRRALLLFAIARSLHLSLAQSSIPQEYDGFPYGGAGPWSGSVIVEAFMDPLCPDSRDSWTPLKQAIQHYSSRVSLIVHPFPLPYHYNSFVACRALHIANKLNASTTYPLLELFFEKQERWYNAATENTSMTFIIDDIAKFAVTTIGDSSFKSGFGDSQTDGAARTSFKYGCLRGVNAAPYFFVNGFPVPGAGSALEYSAWRKIIDPLLNKKKLEKEGDSLIYLE